MKLPDLVVNCPFCGRAITIGLTASKPQRLGEDAIEVVITPSPVEHTCPDPEEVAA